MPKINKKEIKTKSVKYSNEKKKTQESFYSTTAWRRLRDTYISLHPICEECIKHSHVTEAKEVHHKKPFMRGETEEERWQLFLDEHNLMSLCDKCHSALHTKDNMYHMNVLDELTDKEYNYAHFILEK